MERFRSASPEGPKGQEYSKGVSEFLEARGLSGAIETVPLYGGVRIETSPNGEARVLITEALNGCTAIVVATERADGSRSAQMIHFPPDFLDSHLRRIDELAKVEDRAAPRKEALLYMSERRQANREALEAHMRTLYGDALAITNETYAEKSPNPQDGILAAELPAKGAELAKWHTQKSDRNAKS